MALFRRSPENPIILPTRENFWESEAAFNGSAVKHGARIHMVYRAVSPPQNNIPLEVSTIGYGVSTDGIHFKKRVQLLKPEYEWEKFGCEDPRITRLGNKYYIFYTAISKFPFAPEEIKVGVAVTKDFKKIEKHQATTFNSKAMALFPAKIKGKMAAVLTANTDKPPAKIALAYFDKEEDMWSPEFWERWLASLDSHALPLQRSEQDQVEVGAPPVRTKYGWLLFYSYIKDYFTPSRRVFGIEAALLDLKDPSKILARTYHPFLFPEEEYEEYGKVPKVIFPSGAVANNKKLLLYYGAADTTCCLAVTDTKRFIDELFSHELKAVTLERSEANPIISPISEHNWEAKMTFNPGVFYDGRKVHMLYRAMSPDNTSVMGYASSTDGIHFDRLPDPVYIPREDFESKKNPGGNSGCEDPRLIPLGDTIYMCYTAFDGINPPRVALTSISMADFTQNKWNWAKPVLVSPPNIDDKDAALFPRKIDGKFVFVHRIGSSIWIDSVENIEELGKSKWLDGQIIMQPRPETWDSKKIGLSCPPIETPQGWLMLYHGVSATSNKYRAGCVLLDLKDPRKVLRRSIAPILKPEMEYERIGEVPNVVFPCGTAILGEKIFVYYGGADKVIGVATANFEALIDSLPAAKHSAPDTLK